jgi:hypothetical protein
MASLMPWHVTAVIAVLVLLAAMMAVVLHKVRRIHLAVYAIEDQLAETRREVLALFKQGQALLTLERRLGLPEGLPPVRGWAGSPDFLLQVADRILSTKPATIVECGSGVSTIVAARCAQLNQRGHVGQPF